jgi:hypothetical protein
MQEHKDEKEEEEHADKEEEGSPRLTYILKIAPQKRLHKNKCSQKRQPGDKSPVNLPA